ncbi:MAG: sigma-54-dependent Fis family transcriptional regulator [Proteobacteria bacterium]|nr:sigma-54-dependent Fis family transcriptional regulator [Pseudomonadota bacterium]
MASPIQLNKADREFFRLINEVGSTNPFCEKRLEMERRITDGAHETKGENSIDLVILKVLRRIKELEKSKRADWRRYRDEDSRLVFGVLLFDVYYRFTEDFDHLILAQVKAGDKPCKVPFAREVLALLCNRGFTEEESVRFFAICYQLRRAFYFIHHSLIGQSASMGKLRCDLWNNVFTFDIREYEKKLWNRMEDFSTLILGETGSGKGAAAAAIGRSGFIPFDAEKGTFVESFTRNFIGVNLSQFPEALIESELFGHKKGAFTGAIDDQPGVFALCTPHGSIFIDEIGDASIPVQIKLLQVLQERTFSPLGERIKCRFNGRVIAATNKPLDTLLQRGVFREDFYYRLCSDVITVPPLRQRLEEDPMEMDALLELLVERTLGEPSSEWVSLVRDILYRNLGENYAWPGNVREVEQAVRRIVLSREYRGHLYAKPASDNLSEQMQLGINKGNLTAKQLLSTYCTLLYRQHKNLEEVARRTQLDRRTVKKYLLAAGCQLDSD